MEHNQNPLLTSKEAAAYLRLSPKTLANQRVAGGGPRFIKCGRVLYPLAELIEHVRRRTYDNTSGYGDPDPTSPT
jgi:hypothetical protein